MGEKRVGSMKFSVVIPLKDEQDNVIELIQELEPIMASFKEPWELICIDDGSKDQTLEILQSLKKERPHLKILAFDKNYGQTSAFDAGFKIAQGEFIITLDGDRQNDPKDIPDLVKLASSHDLVVGWRYQRKDSFVKKITSRIANFVRGYLCRDGLHDTGCSLKVYRRKSLETIRLFHGMHRFLPALFHMHGYKITELPVNHRERTKGKTKYNFFNRSFNTIADMLAVRWMASRLLRYKVDREWT